MNAAPRPRLGALFAGYVALLVWLPVPLGSNRPWSSGLMAAVALALLGAWCLAWAMRPFRVPRALAEARVLAALLAAWVAYTVLQAAALPPALLEVLAPRALEAYRAAGADGGAAGAISLDRGASALAATRLAGYAALAILTLALVDTRRRLRVVLAALFGIGVAEAGFGLAGHVAGDWAGIWRPEGATPGVTGTYVNRNHLAGLMELSIPAGLALAFEALARRGATGLRGALDFALGRGAALAFGLVLACAALVLSTSRGGLLGLAGGVAIAAALMLRYHGWSRTGARLALGAAGACVLAMTWFGLGALPGKLQAADFAGSRPALLEASARIARDHPVAGVGAGAYAAVLPAYEDERLAAGVYEHAHNDYLELAAEQGAIGAALALAALAVAGAGIVAGVRRRRDPLARGALFAAVAGTAALLLHGLVDFNLRIPANAAWFAVLLGLGLAAGRAEAG